MNYLRYILKIFFGTMIIIALDVILKKSDPHVGGFWFFITLFSYLVYCFVDYIIKDRNEKN